MITCANGMFTKFKHLHDLEYFAQILHKYFTLIGLALFGEAEILSRPLQCNGITPVQYFQQYTSNNLFPNLDFCLLWGEVSYSVGHEMLPIASITLHLASRALRFWGYLER